MESFEICTLLETMAHGWGLVLKATSFSDQFWCSHCDQVVGMTPQVVFASRGVWLTLGEFCYRWLCLLFMLDSYHFSLLISLSLSTVDRWYSDTDRNLPRQSQQGRSADESTGRNKDSWRLSPPTWTRFRSMGIRDRSPWGKFIFHHIFAPHGVSC